MQVIKEREAGKITGYILSVNELTNFLHAAKKLQALEAMGVDNWEWYDEAMKDINEAI